MRVTAYIHPKRTLPRATGVTKHFVHMVRGLAEWPDVQLQQLAPRKELDASGRLAEPSLLRDLPTVGHPGSRRVMEKLWAILNAPKVDRWIGPADWIYCPAEAYVASAKARQAITIHQTYSFEPGLLPIQNSFFLTWFRQLFRIIIHRADLLLIVSEFLRGRLVELFGADPAKMVVVGNGVEDAYFQLGSAAGNFDRRNPYLLLIGGLTYIKGADYVLDTARALRKSGSGTRILIAGKSDPPFADAAKAIDNIVELDYQPVEALTGLMSGAAGLLVLSRYESFGIPAAEAMAIGTPVIAAPRGAVPEVVADAGIFVDPQKPQEIVEAAEQLVRDDSFRAGLVSRGRARAEQFRWSRCVERLHAALQRAG
jgi:glycosyltransferase involved in cell wall biosynthesis